MKTKKEPKTKASELEAVDDIFMVEKDSRKLIGLKPDIKEVPENMIIPDGIEVIGKGAFLSNRFQHNNIKSVKFPDSLKKIEEEAFLQCVDLTDIQFGNGLEYMEYGGSSSLVSEQWQFWQLNLLSMIQKIRELENVEGNNK